MSKELAELKIYRKSSDHYIYVKSPWLENFFSILSESQMGTITVGTCHSLDGEGTLFEFYKVRHLPATPYSLQANLDVMNNYGWLRGKGLTHGFEVPVAAPITTNMASEILTRVQKNIQSLYSIEDRENDVLVHSLLKGI